MIDVQDHVRILYESSVREALLDQGLGFFDGEARQMDVVDQRQIHVAIACPSRLLVVSSGTL